MNCEFEKLQDERDVLFVVSLAKHSISWTRRGRSYNCDLDRWKAVGRTMESAFDCITSIICRKRRRVSRVHERHAQVPYRKSRGSAATPASGFISNGNGIPSVQRSHH